MRKEENTSRGGVGFCGLLAIAFIVLKLIGVIDWPWGMVLAPLWVPVCIGLVGFAVVYVIIKIKG